MATKFKKKKQETESLWNMLLDMGLLKAISLLWTIMIFVAGVSLYIMWWLIKPHE